MHAVDAGDGGEGLFEVFDAVDGEGGLEVGEDGVLFGLVWDGFGCLCGRLEGVFWEPIRGGPCTILPSAQGLWSCGPICYEAVKVCMRLKK